MAKIPSFKRLNIEDYKEEDKQLIEQLGLSINDGIQSINEALNKKLTIDDNFLGSIKDVDVRVDATGTPTTQTFLATGISGAPKGLLVIKAENLNNAAIGVTGAPFLTWSVVSNGVQITNVKGIPSGYTFRLRVLTLG